MKPNLNIKKPSQKRGGGNAILHARKKKKVIHTIGGRGEERYGEVMKKGGKRSVGVSIGGQHPMTFGVLGKKEVESCLKRKRKREFTQTRQARKRPGQESQKGKKGSAECALGKGGDRVKWGLFFERENGRKQQRRCPGKRREGDLKSRSQPVVKRTFL